jgi:hypothetical protein
MKLSKSASRVSIQRRHIRWLSALSAAALLAEMFGKVVRAGAPGAPAFLLAWQSAGGVTDKNVGAPAA